MIVLHHYEHKAYEVFVVFINKDVIALRDVYRDEVIKSLVEARNEVRKCYGDLNDDKKVLDIAVTYDGS